MKKPRNWKANFALGHKQKSAEQYQEQIKIQETSYLESALQALTMEDIFSHVVAEKRLINDECPSIDIFDIDYFTSRLKALKEAFPEPYFTHAMALKGNSFRGVIRIALDYGFGCECASLPEAIHALSSGCPNQNVIFDSPVKTRVSTSLSLADICLPFF